MKRLKTYRITATETNSGSLSVNSVEMLRKTNQHKQEFVSANKRAVRNRELTVR